MKKYISSLATALTLAIAAITYSAAAQAASYTPFSQLEASAAASSNLLKLVDYDSEYYDSDDRHSCDYTRYEKKYVCEHVKPRCFKQRECIWYYGREYCRYVRKCVGGDKYCKWVNVPVNDCECRNCW